MTRHIEIAKGARRPAGPFARIEEAVEAIRTGRMVIVVDDEDRENEGDLRGLRPRRLTSWPSTAVA